MAVMLHKADHDREVFSTLFTTPNAGAGTDFWLRLTTVKPTADPHKQWRVLDNGARYTLSLWRSSPMFSAGETRPRVFVSRLVGGLFGSTGKSQDPRTGLH